MRRYLLQEAYANGGGSETLVHAVQRRGEGVGGRGSGSGAGSGRGGSGGGGSGSGGIDGGEVFDLVWEALEGLDQDSACVEVRVVPWGVRCVFEMRKGRACVARGELSWPGGFLWVFRAQPAVGRVF